MQRATSRLIWGLQSTQDDCLTLLYTRDMISEARGDDGGLPPCMHDSDGMGVWGLGQSPSRGSGQSPDGVWGSAPAGCGAAPRRENFDIFGLREGGDCICSMCCADKCAHM